MLAIYMLIILGVTLVVAICCMVKSYSRWHQEEYVAHHRRPFAESVKTPAPPPQKTEANTSTARLQTASRLAVLARGDRQKLDSGAPIVWQK